MQLVNRAKTRLIATLCLSLGIVLSGTVCGAQSSPPAPADKPAAQATNPELDRADSRVGEAKEKLDTARKQLNASKALVKAAEAEFKAARADRDAIAARATAQQLADASGFPTSTKTIQDGNRSIIVPSNGGLRLTPVDQPAEAPAVPAPLPAGQALDMNAMPTAPTPDNDLKPSMNEPNAVP